VEAETLVAAMAAVLPPICEYGGITVLIVWLRPFS
jgi:hypothetical protein